MKVVILAGGLGTRISEESHLKPKPMIEIGEQPILWHIMKIYSTYGFHDFIICAGYKQHLIKEYFANYFLHTSDITFDFRNNNEMVVHHHTAEPWRVTVVDTGLHTMTGGRIKRIQDYVGKEAFLFTYGDSVGNVDIPRLVQFHRSRGTFATLTTAAVGQRFGVIDVGENGIVQAFREKKGTDAGLINGGYMVLEPEVFDYIAGDDMTFEQEPLENLACDGQLTAYKHTGFWQCMDTQRDKMQLEALWETGKAPWKIWK